MKGGSMIAARGVQIPGVRAEPLIASGRIFNPVTFYWKASEEWRSGISSAMERMAGHAEAAGTGAVIVAGDFDGTPDIRQFRDLGATAIAMPSNRLARVTRRPFTRTPYFRRSSLSDHMLTRNAAVSSTRTIDLSRRDHLGLLATVELPRGTPDPAAQCQCARIEVLPENPG